MWSDLIGWFAVVAAFDSTEFPGLRGKLESFRKEEGSPDNSSYSGTLDLLAASGSYACVSMRSSKFTGGGICRALGLPRQARAMQSLQVPDRLLYEGGLQMK